MSHTWKFLPLAALAVLGAFMLLPGGVTHTPSAKAAQDCSEDNNTRIIVTIIDLDTDDPLEIPGAVVRISPDPFDDDGQGRLDVTDNSAADDDDDPGVIELEDICGDDGEEPTATFDVELRSLPGPAAECEIEIDEVEDVEFPLDGATRSVVLEIDCDDVNLSVTPTASATTTGPAATVIVSSSNNNLGCGATSIVTITVRGANGQPVAPGTIVNIVADRGSVSPASGQTTADGSVFVFYTAPNNQGGEATVTAASGAALGSTEIDINCNIQPTQPPPPTQPVGGIQPPNTGDGGLSTSNTWHTYAGVALILSSVITTLAVIRSRA